MIKLVKKTFLICTMLLMTAPIHAVELNWDVNTWPAPVAGVPTLSQTYAIGGGNVTVTIAGDTGALTSTATGTAASPQTNARNTGGIVPAEDSLLLRMDFPEGTPAVNAQEVTVTYTFSHPGGVNIPQFDVFDVDSSGSNQFTDIAIASGSLAAGGAINPTNIISGTANNNNGVDTATGTGASGGTSSAGNVTYVFGQSGVSSFTFTYRNSAPNTNGSHLQAASIHDISFFVAPAVDKTFTPNVITSGGVSTVTITLTNNEGTNAILSADLIDTLPAGVIVDSPVNIGGSCPGTTNATAGGNTITYASGSVIPTGACTITVDVTSTTPGTYTNNIDIGDLQTNFGLNTIAANDDLTVNPSVGVSTCPAGTTLVNQTGNADVATGAGGTQNPSNAIGGLETLPTTASNGNSARLLGGDTLTLDLSDTVPMNGIIVISIARDNNNGNVRIQDSTDGITYTGTQTFNSPPNDTLQYINYTVQSTNGAQFLRFTRLSGRVWVDGVEYSQICQSPPSVDLVITKDDGVITTYTPGETTTYIITVTNIGPDNAAGASVDDVLPRGVTLNGAVTCVANGTANCGTISTGSNGGDGTQDFLNVTGVDVNAGAGNSVVYSVPVQFSVNMSDY